MLNLLSAILLTVTSITGLSFLTASLPPAGALPAGKLIAQIRDCSRTWGTFTFFEGNNGGQDRLGSVSDCFAEYYQLKKVNTSGVPNDEARSVRIQKVKANTQLFVYDSPGCDTKAPYARIITKTYIKDRTVNSFQESFEDGEISLSGPGRKRKLDGKISCIQVDSL